MDNDDKKFLHFLQCATNNHLRFMIVGGYAVNFYGYHRASDDLDIGIAPTNKNKPCFLETLKCMDYSDEEISIIREEDFTTYFICSIGTPPHVIDILTVIHKRIQFDKAEKLAQYHPLSETLKVPFVPYPVLKDIKLRSTRGKDLFDIARLEELINKKI